MTVSSSSNPPVIADANASVTVQLVGGPTAVIEIGGIRLITDPTFDPPGDHPVGERNLVKTTAPAVPVDDIGPVDVVLLSHDEHPDNLDDAGRRFLGDVPLVLSTAGAAERLGGVTCELPLWRSHVLRRPDGGELRITGVPAQHGPAGTEHLTGEVRGFVLSGVGLPTVYVSGDNASLAVVRDVADHAGPVDIAIIFGGHARSPVMDAYLTFSADQVAQAAEILDAPTVIPIHLEGWKHLTQESSAIPPAFARRGLSERLLMLDAGETVTVAGKQRPPAEV
ncbi:MBL fold metallo-hydrolase [Pseudonocardia sp. CA-142604]|uniref:MBL fold metallo-hydrolase n=1 Tax=Pseudonocardia sp. CA-142604 TaxID=3240024 RepID=UPI003D8D404A